jgi:predicted DNA-binding transcriptional regulator AlpA
MRVGRLRAVRQITGYSKSTIARLEQAGLFPRRFRFADNAWPVWDLDEIEAAMAAAKTKVPSPTTQPRGEDGTFVSTDRPGRPAKRRAS